MTLINNFISKTPAGLFCIPGEFYLDPGRAVSRALVSHAHSDHAVSTSGKVYCTKPTRAFMQLRMGKRQAEFILVEFGKSFRIGEVEIVFYPAGHILGSAQVLMIHKGVRYLYTGDFKTQTDESCELFEYVNCDYLITETTFASPEYSHPDPEEEIKSLLKDHEKVVIGAYILGKAQRLNNLISRHAKEVKVFIHPDLRSYHELYAMHGYSPGKWDVYRREEFNDAERAVYIVPPAYFRRHRGDGKLLRVFATGWKNSFYRCDRVLRISDHADWTGVLEMISKSNASHVYTVHGNGEHLKAHLKDKIKVSIFGK